MFAPFSISHFKLRCAGGSSHFLRRENMYGEECGSISGWRLAIIRKSAYAIFSSADGQVRNIARDIS